MNRIATTLMLVVTCALTSFGQDAILRTPFQKQLQDSLAVGWNTWSYGSMLTHVLLPSAFSMRVNFRRAFIGTPYDPDHFYEDITVDKTNKVRPIAHSFDGAYTELLINDWFGNSIKVQSCSQGEALVILVTPVARSSTRYYIELQTGMMWNRQGHVMRTEDFITASSNDKTIFVRSTQKPLEVFHNYSSPYLVVPGDSTVGFYTGPKQSLSQIKAKIDNAQRSFYAYSKKFKEKSGAFEAIESVLGWNTLYDPTTDRVITPVTRGWNEAWQGYVLFEWDTYFAALLFGLDNKKLAYSNVLAVTHGPRPGLVGFWKMPGIESVQSQPPVGSMVCWMLYEKYREKQFLIEVYDQLLEWNRWWINNRVNRGYLTWGAPWKGAEPKHALLESGLDNSPMYEHVKMEEVGDISMFNLGDVGLNSLYVADCRYLAKIAQALGRKRDVKELNQRADDYADKVQKLWNEERGIFLNRYLDRDEFSERLSPTLFYPMMAGIATPRQASRMIKEHLYNPKEFYGEYMLPSISFQDKSFDNNYWRGSVWGPMNFLVYLGLKQHDSVAAKMLAMKSYDPFLKAWKEHNYVFENINSVKGPANAHDQVNCDPYYHWGALMGLLLFLEDKQY